MPASPESTTTTTTTAAAASNQSSSSSSSSDDVIIDVSPLLSNNSLDPNPSPNRPNAIPTASSSSSTLRRGSQTLREAARFLRRASSRRMMREPSMLVREAAAEQLEERQTDWAYSRPVVVLDLIWNFAFVAAAAGVFIVSGHERPAMPLRIWIIGYVMQCVLHMFCVVSEYRRRQRSASRSGSGVVRRVDDVEGSGGEVSREYVSLSDFNEDATSSVAKHLESANTMFSFIWWIIGFYWVSAGGTQLAHDAPQLYWLCIIFLGFDVFFVVFCVALACVIGIAVCCCLPCIIAILYAVAEQEGASSEDIERLPKFKFRAVGNNEKSASDIQEPLGGMMTECGSTDSPIEHYLSHEDAECCICLSAYEDGVELMELPCRHHFHRTCVDKWLRINATCPLCKYNISKSVDDPEEV